MLLNKHSLTIPARFVGNDAARPAIQNVQITNTETVATDGHRLAVLTHPNEPVNEFPDVGVNDPTIPLTVPVLVDADEAIRIGKAIPTYRSTLPILAHALLDAGRANEDGTVPFVVTDLGTKQTFEPKKADGQYPDWHQLMPTGAPRAVVGFNPRYLEQIGKAFADFLGVRVNDRNPVGKIVELRTYGPSNAAQFSAMNKDTGQTLRIVCMPMWIKTGRVGVKSVNRTHLAEWAETVCADLDVEY